MNPAARKYLAAIGRKGGRAGTGQIKARTKAQARAAARVRWDLVRAAKGERHK
jgi:hypothetical protein